MKHLNLVILCVLMSMSASCDDKDEPVNPPQYRISWIYFDHSYHDFEYDSKGRISKFEYHESDPDWIVSYISSYSYPDNDNVISIASEEQFGTDIWSYDEKLYLNQDGTASHAIGIATLRNNDGLMITKNYTIDFLYNSSQQLIKVNTAEKRTKDTGWEEPTALEWCAELEWTDDNLVRYSEYSNPKHPTLTKTFTYFTGETAHYLPIVQGPVMRRYYLPLQYQGVLGKQSASMVKTMEITSDQREQMVDFSYDISASVYNSWVEGYTELRNGKETKYTIGWEEM